MYAMEIFLSAIRNPQSAIGTQSAITTAGSPLWQIGFFAFGAILILIEVIRGWRLGILRQLMRVVAVMAGYAAAYFGGDMVVPLLRTFLELPDIVLSAIGGAILAIAVYGIIAGLGSLVFKRTAQQPLGVVRWIYGLSGALLGVCFGMFFLWLILIGIRSVGSIAQAQAYAQARPLPGKNPGSVSGHSSPVNQTSDKEFDLGAVTTALARLKNSVELGPMGEVVKKTDAMPNGVYQTLNEAGTVFSNPEAAQRFLSYPGTRQLSEHPKIVALREDPEIAEMIAQGRILELIRHPRVVEAMNDPTITKQVKGFDLKKALEYAGKK
jgi:membrane protein required for colicin V production